jgi:AcrR family transcriptional regulator
MSKTSEAEKPVSIRVTEATRRLILKKGLRKLRTAEIASAAATTESTLFRHFDNLNDIVVQTFESAWGEVNRRVADAAFERAHAGDAAQRLLGDMNSLWSLRDDPQAAEAAMLAFLFLRRQHEIVDEADPPTSQLRFEQRVRRLCDEIVAETGDARLSGHVLAQLVLNHAATVWLTWYWMLNSESTETNDTNETVSDHFSADEAQLGLVVLLDRFRSAERDSFR